MGILERDDSYHRPLMPKNSADYAQYIKEMMKHLLEDWKIDPNETMEITFEGRDDRFTVNRFLICHFSKFFDTFLKLNEDNKGKKEVEIKYDEKICRDIEVHNYIKWLKFGKGSLEDLNTPAHLPQLINLHIFAHINDTDDLKEHTWQRFQRLFYEIVNMDAAIAQEWGEIITEHLPDESKVRIEFEKYVKHKTK